MPAQTPELKRVAEKHTLHRLFLGPLPERVLSAAQHPAMKSAGGKESRRLLSFTQTQRSLKLGGSEEEWNEEQEINVKDEMSRRWSESAWGRLWHRRKDTGVSNASQARWVLPNEAGSFQIGEFLGLNTYAEPAPRSPRFAAADTGSLFNRAGPSTSQVRLDDPSMTTGDTFVTARSHISPEPEPYTAPSRSGSPFSPDVSYDIHAVTSTTSLLRTPAAGLLPIERTRSGPTSVVSGLKPALKARPLTQAKSDGAIGDSVSTPLSSDKGKGKAKKAVRLPREPSPAPPLEVLERTGSRIQETSAAATEELQAASTPSPVLLDIPDEYEDAKMKDRMVVRVAYSRDGSVGSRFDEVQNRSARNMVYEDWAEFMVVWRNDRLELYGDYKLPCRERFAGHKHLAFVVPLKSVRTRLSLYSFTDISFCITCPPASLRAGMKTLLPFQRRTGTNVFIFKARSRSRAIDWIWHLWRTMNGKLPSFIEVRSPVLDTRMKIDIPENPDYAVFSHDNLVALSMRTFSTVQDWDVIVQKRLAEGAHLELAWRLDTNLDWVWWHDDIYGNPRAWAVLAGLALNQAGRAAHLEVRLAEHTASQLHIKDGHQLSEPPSIEGYVSCVRSASGGREEVYLTVHNGLLFTLVPTHAHTPNLPGVVPVPHGADQDIRDTLREEEVRRGAKQVSAARCVMDLRAVVAVRRAFRPIFHPGQPVHNSMPPDAEEDEQQLNAEVAHEESDALDVGGNAGLTGDVTTMRMRRCFELVTKTGNVIRFETWSAPVAIEWIERLRALIRYWKLRHIVDTRQEMDVVHFATGRPRITPHRLRDDDEDDKPRLPEPPSNPAVALPYLGSIYHWCVYEGCRPITKCGRIYVRQGLHGGYKLMELFLVAGELVQFHVKPKSTQYPRRERSVSLLDAYVMSGVFAAQALPKGQYNPNNPVTPRRYADGLESDDAEENTLFVVYYVPHKVGQVEKVPSLNATKKMIVFRCRSRVERDVWCWALNTEIEKLAREKRDREEKWRDVGAPIPLRA